VTFASTQIAVEEAVLHEDVQGRLDGLCRAYRKWRVARADDAMMMNVGTWGVAEPLMCVPRPPFHRVDLIGVAAAT